MANPIKLCFIIEATIGGTRRHLRDVITSLSDENYELSLIYSNQRDSFFYLDLELYKQQGVQLFECNMKRGISIVHDIKAFFQIKKTLKRIKPDIVHAISSKAGVLGRLVASAMSIPCIYAPHVFATQMRVSKTKKLLYFLIEKRLVNKTKELHCVSSDEVNEAKRLGYVDENINLIPNGINVKEYENISFPSDDKVHIAFVGRFSEQKGVLLLPEIIQTCHDKNVHFHLFGDGEFKKDIESQCRGMTHVTFYGQVEDMKTEMHRYHILLHPSLWESHPYTILENVAAGKTCIVSDKSFEKSFKLSTKLNYFETSKNIDCINIINAVLKNLNSQKKIILSEGIKMELSLERMIEELENVYKGIFFRFTKERFT